MNSPKDGMYYASYLLMSWFGGDAWEIVLEDAFKEVEVALRIEYVPLLGLEMVN